MQPYVKLLWPIDTIITYLLTYLVTQHSGVLVTCLAAVSEIKRLNPNVDSHCDTACSMGHTSSAYFNPAFHSLWDVKKIISFQAEQ